MPYIATINPDKQLKDNVPVFKSGDLVRIHQRIKEVTEAGKDKERTQIFEGLVIARKHGAGPTATFTVRKISYGIGVERIFPLHSPNIEKIEVVKSQNVRQSKIYYVRSRLGSEPRVRKPQAK